MWVQLRKGRLPESSCWLLGPLLARREYKERPVDNKHGTAFRLGEEKPAGESSDPESLVSSAFGRHSGGQSGNVMRATVLFP